MIDKDGNIRCEECGKKHSLKLIGKDYEHEWYCRSCHHYNREEKHILDNKGDSVILSK